MPKLNLYEQQTSAQGPRASGADFGAGPAQALGEMGNVVSDIGARIQRREELFASDQIMGDVDTWAVTALDDFQKRQDITTQQALPEFQNALKQKRDEALSKFQGSPDARAALTRQLDNQVVQYGKAAIGSKIKAGHEQLTRGLNQQFDKSMNEVGTAPQILGDSISENIAYVESRKPAMTAEMYQQAMTMARAKPIQSAVQAYVANGNWGEAEKIMADPEVAKLLDPSVARSLRIDVAVGRGKQEKEQRDLTHNARQWEAVTGSTIDPSKYAELPDFKSAPAAQKIASYKLIHGVEPTAEMKQRFFGLDKARDDSLIEQVSEMAPAYGTMNPQDQLKFQLMVKKVWPDRRGEDKFGNPTMFSTVPSQLESIIGGGGGGRPMSGGSPVLGSTTGGSPMTLNDVGMQAEGYPIDEKGEFVPGGQKGQSGPGGQRTRMADAPAGDEGEVNLYDSADKMVGLESWIKRNASKLPLGIGDRVKVDPLYAEAAKASQILQNDVTEGLRNAGGRDANQYRQELKRIVSIDPALMNSTRNYRVEMRTIDKELRTRLKNYQTVAETGATKEMRQDAAAAVATISTIVGRLNIPQKLVKTREEYEKLAPGTRFMYGDDPTPLTKGATK